MKKEMWRKGFVLLIIYQTVMSLYRCGMDVWTFWMDKSMRNYAATDYLINYQGGFVRRGMIGEVLYQLRLHLGVDPLPVLTVLAVACFVGLAFMMLRAFRRKGLAPYILPLVICMGMVFASRKDYGMILLVWAAAWTYLHLQEGWAKVAVPTLVLLFLLNVHEASLLFAWPMLALLMLREKGLGKGLKAVGVIVPVVMFVVLCSFKGTAEMAQAIHDSWKPFLPASWGDVPDDNSIAAIGWSAKNTMLMHLWWNYFCYYPDFSLLHGWMVRPVVYLMIFYLLANYPLVFRKADEAQCKRDSVNMGRIALFQFLMLLPMFTVLSNDLGRVVCYWTLSSLVFYLLVPAVRLEGLFPRFFCRMADGLNAGLSRVVKPSWGVLAMVMLVICFTPVKLNLHVAVSLSTLGSLYFWLKGVVALMI